MAACRIENPDIGRAHVLRLEGEGAHALGKLNACWYRVSRSGHFKSLCSVAQYFIVCLWKMPEVLVMLTELVLGKIGMAWPNDKYPRRKMQVIMVFKCDTSAALQEAAMVDCYDNVW